MNDCEVERALKYQRRKQRKANIARGYVPLSQALQNESRPPGWKSLAMAVIEQAVMDYCLLVRNGYIKQMKLTGKRLELIHGGSKRCHVQGIYQDMIQHLVDFWQKGHCMSVINLAMYERGYKELDADMMLKGLLRMEEIGNIYPKGRRV